MENYQYVAFISYRHIPWDSAIAQKLHTQIENYAIPKNVQLSSGRKKMGRVFRDQEELPLSRDLTGDIYKVLDNSEWLIVIASPDYLTSKWCLAELDYFISLGRRDHILTILANGHPNDAFADQLRYVEIDGVLQEREPLAADVRADSLQDAYKKLNNEKLRLLAPMLDVNFDELRQRARRRRTRIISAISAAVFLLMSGFLGYSLYKNQQITKERNTAQANQLQLLIEQANISTSDSDKLQAVSLLREAETVRNIVGNSYDQQYQAALEYALYNTDFETIMTLDNNNRQFDSLVFSHDGKYLLGITNLNSACIIEVSSGSILYTVSVNDVGMLDYVGFTDDDRYFYMVDNWYNYVTVYEVSTGKLYGQYEDADNGMAWNIGEKVWNISNNRLLIVRQKDIVLWDYVNNKTETILPLPDDGAFNTYTQPLITELSEDRKYIAIGSHGYGQGMKIVSLDGKEVTDLSFDETRGYTNLRFSKDGKYLAATSGSMYFVWDRNGRIVLSGDIEEQYEHEFFASAEQVELNSDGSILLIMNSDLLEAVNVKTGGIIWQQVNQSNIITEAVISPDGKYVAATGGIKGVFDIKTGEMLCDRGATTFSDDSGMVISDAYTSNPVILCTPESSTVTVIDNWSRKLYTVARFTDPGQVISIDLKHFSSDIYQTPDRTSSSFISPDLKYGVYTHFDGFMEVFDISDPVNPKNIYSIAEHCYNCVNDLVFHGDMMASCGGYDPRCVLFDLEKGQIKHVLMGQEYCHGSEFSPDGTKIIMLCGYGADKAYVYSVENGNLLYMLTAPQGRTFYDVGFTEDGTMAVALMDNGSALCGIIYPTLEELVSAARDR